MAIMQWINPPTNEIVEEENIIPPDINVAGQEDVQQLAIQQFPNAPGQVIIQEQVIPQQNAQDRSIQGNQPIIQPLDNENA